VATGWIYSIDNFHCPVCDALMVQRGILVQIPGGVRTTNSNPTTVTCPYGHPTPRSSEDLRAYRDEKGYPPEGTLREAPPPMPR
jgi:hypothetical protein